MGIILFALKPDIVISALKKRRHDTSGREAKVNT